MSREKDPIATDLVGGVLQALIEAYDDPEWAALAPCAVGLVSGANLVADHCCDVDEYGTETATGEPCEGQLTLRVVNSFPTVDFPAPYVGAMPECGTSWAVELEVAIMRCALGMDDSVDPPRPPSMADEIRVAERALDDAGLIRQILVGYARAHGNQGISLGSWLPLGPDGGCVGGTVLSTFLVE